MSVSPFERFVGGDEADEDGAGLLIPKSPRLTAALQADWRALAAFASVKADSTVGNGASAMSWMLRRRENEGFCKLNSV